MVRSSRIRRQNALTEKAREDAVQGLRKVRITSLISLSAVVKNVNKMLIKMATNINTGSIYYVYCWRMFVCQGTTATGGAITRLNVPFSEEL